jgi:short-subunit dehydrogenase
LNNKTVLITGASSGIGYELAKVFAEKGYNIVLVARRENILNEMAEKILKCYGVKTKVIQKDLTKINAAKEVFNEVKKSNINIDILVNNAGIGSCGFFHEIELKKHIDTININITALTELTRLFVKDMIERKQGKILNVASTGAYQPGPIIAVYYATKAYVLSFSEAICNELKHYNITVTALCPGTTSTEFSKNAGKCDLKNAMNPRKVAEIAYDGLMKGKKVVVPGILNKFLVFLSKITPRSILANIVKKIQSNAIFKS